MNTLEQRISYLEEQMEMLLSAYNKKQQDKAEDEERRYWRWKNDHRDFKHHECVTCSSYNSNTYSYAGQFYCIRCMDKKWIEINKLV